MRTRAHHGAPKRTRADKRAAMETRLILARSIDGITVDDLIKHGFKRDEAEQRLQAERERER